jgi:hypothetical protein
MVIETEIRIIIFIKNSVFKIEFFCSNQVSRANKMDEGVDEMYKKVSLLMILFVAIYSNVFAATLSSEWNTFVGQFQLLKQAIEESKFESASFHFQRMNHDFPKLIKTIELTTDGYHEFAECMIDLGIAMRALRLDERQLQLQVQRMSLVIDAISKTKYPVYLSSVNVLRNDVMTSINTKRLHDINILSSVVESHYARWQIIRSAMIIDDKTTFVSKIDSLFTHTRSRKDVHAILNGLESLSKELSDSQQTVFMHVENLKLNHTFMIYFVILFFSVSFVLAFAVRKIYLHENR